MCPRVLTRPPPGHGRIEMEMSSKKTAPDGSRTRPVFANDGHVGGAYDRVRQSPAAGASCAPPPAPCASLAPRWVVYDRVALSECSAYNCVTLKRSAQPP